MYTHFYCGMEKNLHKKADSYVGVEPQLFFIVSMKKKTHVKSKPLNGIIQGQYFVVSWQI